MKVVDLGIKLVMPEESPKRLCDKCDCVHPPEQECEEEALNEAVKDVNDIKELADPDAVEALGGSLDKVKELLGREGFKGFGEEEDDDKA